MTSAESLAERLRRVRVVLVEPRYDGNLGQVARAMRNFGLTRLVLVAGQANPEADEARWFARDEGAMILDGAQRVATLSEALTGCGLVIGTSRRLGRERGPAETPDALLARLAPWRAPYDSALVFGREAHGLFNEELDACHALVHIPTDAACPSLNLAHAVALTGSALWRLAAEDRGDPPLAEGDPPAPYEELERMYEHARRVWLRIGYLAHQNPDIILRRWRRMFGRAQLTSYEVNLVRALVHQTDWAAKLAGIPPGGVLAAPELFNKHKPPWPLPAEDGPPEGDSGG